MVINRQKSKVKDPYCGNPKSRESRVSEVCSILSKLQSNTSPGMYNKILYHLIWYITEGDGKYNTRFRSIQALNSKDLKIHHEHVYPIKDIKNDIMSNPKSIKSILMKKAIACVVTQKEHEQLNKHSKDSDGWERYRKAGVKIKDFITKRNANMKNLIKGSVVYAFLIISLNSFSQEIPCREWHFKKDRYGNEVKTICNIGWQENDIGQKHGKYFENAPSGKPLIRANYKNGKLNGKYVAYGINLLFNDASEVISDSGRYANDVKYGSWLESNYYRTSYDRTGKLLKSKYNDGKMILDGLITADEYYSGKMAFVFSTNWGMEKYFAYLDLHDTYLDFSKNTTDIIDWIFKDHRNERDLNKSFKLICQVANGDIVNFQGAQFFIDNVPNQPLLKEKLDSYYAQQKKISDELAQTKAKQNIATLNNKELLEAFKPISISFEQDSYEMDSQGEAELLKLSSFLSSVDTEGILKFVIVGHSGGARKLGKVKFDSKNDDVLYNATTGRKTIMSEAELANLRMILSLGRSKTVFKSLASLSKFQKLVSDKKFNMLPLGTEFGNELQLKNQNIVQIVILTSDGKEINSEIDLVPFGTDFSKSPVLAKANQLIRDLGYNFSKLIPGLIGINSFGLEIPNYLELASDPSNLAAFKKEYM